MRSFDVVIVPDRTDDDDDDDNDDFDDFDCLIKDILAHIEQSMLGGGRRLYLQKRSRTTDLWQDGT